jgi:hypothetical protein
MCEYSYSAEHRNLVHHFDHSSNNDFDYGRWYRRGSSSWMGKEMLSLPGIPASSLMRCCLPGAFCLLYRVTSLGELAILMRNGFTRYPALLALF